LAKINTLKLLPGRFGFNDDGGSGKVILRIIDPLTEGMRCIDCLQVLVLVSFGFVPDAGKFYLVSLHDYYGKTRLFICVKATCFVPFTTTPTIEWHSSCGYRSVITIPYKSNNRIFNWLNCAWQPAGVAES